MFLFMILGLIAVILTVISIAVLSIGGVIGVILFGDVIVCIFIIILVMKKLIFKR